MVLAQRTKEVCVVCSIKQRFIFEYQSHSYCRCPTCGLVSTYPLPDSATIEAHYARKFKSGNYQLLLDYAQDYRQVYHHFARILNHKLAQYGCQFSGLKILDVGCFTGDFLEIVQSLGADVYGLELQSEAVEIANQKLPGRVFKADVSSDEFPQVEFDVITLFGVIEHVIDPVGLLRRSVGLLRSGGVLMLQTPNSSSILARVMGKFWPPYAPVEHIHLFSRESLKLALSRISVEDVATKRHVKALPIAYCYNMLNSFGPEFYRLFKNAYKFLPRLVTEASLPFYIGEMIVTARKT